MEGNERQSFVMYASFLEAAEGLDGEAFKECVLKLRDFALYGEDVSSKDPVINIILTMAKPNLNAAAARYQRCVENGSKGKEHGAKGGRPRKGETLEAYEARRRKPETPRKPLDDEDDEKENEKENNDVDVKLIQSPAATEPASFQKSRTTQTRSFWPAIRTPAIWHSLPTRNSAGRISRIQPTWNLFISKNFP